MKSALERKNKERACLKRFSVLSCTNEKRIQLRKHYVTPLTAFTRGMRTQVAYLTMYSRLNIKHCTNPGFGPGRRNSPAPAKIVAPIVP